MLSGLTNTSDDLEDEPSGTHLAVTALKNPYFNKACEHKIPMKDES